MKSINTLSRILFVTILSCLVMGSYEGSALAQDNQSLKLDFVGVGGGPPDVVVLSDGTVIFKLTAIEAVTGDLTGTLTEKVTQVYPVSEEDGILPITTSWSLQTASGTIEGCYTGTFIHMRDGSHMITQHGEVLSVTGAYAELYQATVLFQGVLLSDHMTISGTITIKPREKR
jgi:hypothetical protein